MPYPVTIPFFAFKLHFHSGGAIYIPLQKNESVRLNQSIQKIAIAYGEEFQKSVLDQGNYEGILEEWETGDFLKSEIRVDFPAAADGISFPEFSLDFDFFYKKSEKGYWLLIPSIGLETFATEEEELENILKAAIHQEFERNKRWGSVQNVIAAIWYDTTELLRDEVEVKFHTPAELTDIEIGQKKEWLPLVATLLEVNETVTYGREEEMNRFLRAMKGNFSRNILLVGASGVGKTALVWELIHQRKTHDFRGKIWETTASVLIKELTADTGWQDNIERLIKELMIKGDILFVRNLLELFEVGKYEGNSVSIAEYLLTYISRGEVNIISECTEEEKAIIELKRSNYLSNFQIISLTEPTEDLEEIILKKVGDLSDKNKVKIDTESVKETIRLNKRFTPYSGFPGKPIRFLESILLNQVLPKSKSAEENISKHSISRTEVIEHFCEETGMPTFMVDPEIPMDIKKIKAQFNNGVFGQEGAVDSVVNMLSAVKTGLTQIGKPIASFLFVGPTGVGKTELAKVLSEFMFGSRDKMVRFDMSEYSGWDAVGKLLGQSFSSDGLLTSTVKREPFCVLLFDEIEKAHPDFFDLLLQMLSEGRLTDSKGKLVNFCSTIIIMTSNIGATAMQRRTIGPDSRDKNQELEERYLKAVQDYFKPELYNRIDQVIPFAALSKDTVRFVVEREIEQLKKREGIRHRRMDLEIEEEVLDYLAEVGYDPRYGARYLQRALREKIIIPLAEQVNLHDLDDQLMVNISMYEKKIHMTVDADPMGIDLLFEEIEKNDYADLAGEYRRMIDAFQDGFLNTTLESDLDILKREKKKLGEKFWLEKARSTEFSNLLNLQSEIKGKVKEIEKIEANYSLACMNLQTYKPEWSDLLEQWKKDFFQLKVKSLLQSNKEKRHCRLRIYGAHIELLMNFYLELLQRKGFEYTISTVWFRERLFNEKIETENPTGKLDAYIREDYYVRIWEEGGQHNFEPEEKEDQLLGVDLMLVGECPALYLQKESGMQRWKMSDKKQYTYISEIVDINAPFPKNIHKKNAFEKTYAFRTVAPDFLEDKNLGIKREVIRGNYWDLMIPVMDDKFIAAVNVEVS